MKNALSCSVEECFKKFRGLAPDVDDFQNLVVSSFSKGVYISGKMFLTDRQTDRQTNKHKTQPPWRRQ